MEGMLLVDKPAGWTSFDVVKKVRTVVASAAKVPTKQIKVGHSGTLDPFATGLLILLIGKNYTSKADQLLKLDKTYEVIAELDKQSSTGDPEGVISDTNRDGLAPSSNELRIVLAKFVGKIIQTPPAYSAIKVNGVRAYQLARQNRLVVLKSREVSVNSLELRSYRYPLFEIRTNVSSGTYIRTLVEDIGKALGVGAYTKSLRRLSINSYSITEAVKIEQINEQTIASMLKPLS